MNLKTLWRRYHCSLDKSKKVRTIASKIRPKKQKIWYHNIKKDGDKKIAVSGGKNMPVYEFECADGHITEELVRMGTKTTKCSKCSKTAKKIISQCSFELKGGGWYADGYSSNGSKSSKKSD